MDENIVEKEKNEDNTNETDPGKASDEEYRNFKEEPGDDDGENRRPKEKHSIFLTAMFVTKFMIGSSILSVPQILKTFGIINGLLLTCVFKCFTALFFNFNNIKELICSGGNFCFFLLKSTSIRGKRSFPIFLLE